VKGPIEESAEAVRSIILLGATPNAPSPPAVTDWHDVALTGTAVAIVITSFLLAIKHAGKAAR
jgi:hypothetical protein